MRKSTYSGKEKYQLKIFYVSPRAFLQITHEKTKHTERTWQWVAKPCF